MTGQTLHAKHELWHAHVEKRGKRKKNPFISDASGKLDAIGVSQGNLLSKTKDDAECVRKAEEERKEGSRQEEKKEGKEV